MNWDCHQCGQPGIRNIGANGHCARHLGDLYATLDPAVFQLHGIGLPGRTDNDNDLTCTACEATWYGPPGEHCHYCARSRRIQLDHQASLVLEPPDVDPDDTLWAARMEAWVDRLKVAAMAGVVTQNEALHAITRITQTHQAA